MPTNMAKLAVEPEECEYDLQEDVLEMIANSQQSDFLEVAGGDYKAAGLHWAQWCRRIATAAVKGDVDSVARLISIDSPKSGE